MTIQVENPTVQPGQLVTLVLNLNNDIAVRGIQFTLTPDPPVLSLVATRSTARSQTLLPSANQDQASGAITAILMSLGTATIAPGTGAVMEIDVHVEDGVAPGTPVDLGMSGLRIADSEGQPVPTDTPTPTPTPSPSPTPTSDPCGLCGDANGDHAANIVDALFISQLTVGLRTSLACHNAANVNGDQGVDIGDALFISQYTVQLRPTLTCTTVGAGSAPASP